MTSVAAPLRRRVANYQIARLVEQVGEVKISDLDSAEWTRPCQAPQQSLAAACFHPPIWDNKGLAELMPESKRSLVVCRVFSMQPTLDSPTDVGAGSITIHLAALKSGESEAQEWLFGRLLPHVIGLARQRIGDCPSRYHDEYDLALEVLGVLLMRASSFDRLHNRSDLAALLSRLVEYKSVDAYRRMRRRKKIEVGESSVGELASNAESRRRFRTLELSSAEMEAMAGELFDSLIQTISRLKDDELQCRQILKLIVEGYSVVEISQMVGRGERSIYRLLKRIENEFLRSAAKSPA